MSGGTSSSPKSTIVLQLEVDTESNDIYANYDQRKSNASKIIKPAKYVRM